MLGGCTWRGKVRDFGWGDEAGEPGTWKGLGADCEKRIGVIAGEGGGLVKSMGSHGAAVKTDVGAAVGTGPKAEEGDMKIGCGAWCDGSIFDENGERER